MKYLTEDYTITEIRQKAEELLKLKYSERDEEISESDRLKLIHELEVHQIELELKNEELFNTRALARKAAARYNELYNTSPICLLTLTKEGRIVELNTAALQLFEKKNEDLFFTGFKSLVLDEDQPVFANFLESVQKSKNKETCELRLQQENQEKHPVHLILTGILTENDEECLITALDVTQQKKAIEALIENQRLSAIGEMASSISHDFNNALQSIMGNLELLMSIHGSNEKSVRYMNTMKILIEDAIKRVSHLQRYSGSSKAKNQFGIININKLIEEVVEQTRLLWKNEAEIKGIRITMSCELGAKADLLGDESELRSALFNIIKNSTEAMPEGGSLKIKTEVTGENIGITISDTGIGMDEETKTRIFQPFFSTKSYNLGRGMGMSGALNVIKEHKGSISVKKTAPGKGTTIEILLPAYSHISGSKADLVQNNQIVNKTKFLNILWIDDDDDIRTFADEAIRMIGHRLTLAGSGKEGLTYLDHKPYDLVITDIGMSEMNGWQVADKIKEKFNGKMKVAIVSGWGNQIKESDLKEHGVSYILNKPFKIAELNKLLSGINRD